VLATARVLLWTGLQHLANSPGNDGPLGST
jgi:hypothetical protein